MLGSVGVSVLVLALLGVNRAWLAEAITLVRDARPVWLLAAGALITGSYGISAQVLGVVVRSFGVRVGAARVWLIAVGAITISQSIPAGGVGSYAYLIGSFKRRGLTTAQAALVALLEALSYAGAMVLFGLVSGLYIGGRLLIGVGTAPTIAPFVVGGVAIACVIGVVIGLTRSEVTLRRGLMPLADRFRFDRLLRRRVVQRGVAAGITEFVRQRQIVMDQPGMMLRLIVIQLLALLGHSLALLLVLWSLGVSGSLAVVIAAFGVALITSTFNVLPGGGGTVETMLLIVLVQFGIGAPAVPAAILFRLLNFWLFLPIVLVGWLWRARR